MFYRHIVDIERTCTCHDNNLNRIDLASSECICLGQHGYLTFCFPKIQTGELAIYHNGAVAQVPIKNAESDPWVLIGVTKSDCAFFAKCTFRYLKIQDCSNV